VPNESEKERWQRNFSELLQELRVAQTGVQILFAFLLTLVFSARFSQLSAPQRDVYVVALLSAAGATALIIGPVAYHRMLFRQGRKPELVRSAHRMASGGLAMLLVSMVSSVLLVTDFILAQWVAIVLTSAVGLFFVLLWGILPLMRRNQAIADWDELDDDPADRRRPGDRSGKGDRPGTVDGRAVAGRLDPDRASED
jgi:hypothetical protein